MRWKLKPEWMDRAGRTASAVLGLLLLAASWMRTSLERLEAREEERAVFLSEADYCSPGLFGYQDYCDFKRFRGVFDEVAAFDQQKVSLEFAGRHHFVEAAWITEELFGVFNIRPRLAGPDLGWESPGAWLSDACWRENFGADPSAIGASVIVNRKAFRLAGVLPPGFSFPDKTEIWLPIAAGEMRADRGSGHFRVVARLAPETSFKAAQDHFQSSLKALRRKFPEVFEAEGSLLAPIECYPRYLAFNSGVEILERGSEAEQASENGALPVLLESEELVSTRPAADHKRG